MTLILWKIIVVSIFLVQTIIGAYLGWRVLQLMKRVKDVQKDRNELNEERRKLSDKLRLKGIAMEKLSRERPEFYKPERQMIIAALNMPEYGDAIKDPKTSFQVRKVYRDLREKIKESLRE